MDPVKTIAEEMEKQTPDWRAIEAASRELVDSDPKNVRFSVDAGHIRRLGLELVAKQETALIEVIKNAYDADARKVAVSFINHDKEGGIIVVEDDGSGMTLESVKSAWMTISTANKVESPTSPIYGRSRAGKKGIGRFAVQRLGKQLVLETGVYGSTKGIRVSFNWDAEFVAGVALHDVYNKITEYPKKDTESGTKLTILGVREPWTEAEISRTWRAVLLLQPPFKAKQNDTGSERLVGQIDPGFEVQIDGVSSKNNSSAISLETDFLAHSIADIHAEVTEDGVASVTVTSKKLGIDETQSYDDIFLLTGPVRLEAKYFIYAANAMPGGLVSTAGELGRRFGGIRVYRNNFRVLPYGDSSDDWLRLDADVSRRELLMPANNRNLFGQVELHGERNVLFEETSSRQGLIENAAFEELRTFARNGIEWALKRVANYRSRKQRADQKNFVSIVRTKKPSEAIAEIIESAKNIPLTETKVDSEMAIVPQSVLEGLQVAAKEFEKQVEDQKNESLHYEEMLRVLASLGLTVAVFGHEIKGAKASVQSHIALLSDSVVAFPDGLPREKLRGSVEGLGVATSRMFDIGGYISGMVSTTGSRELRTLSVRGAIERFRQQFEEYMKRQQVLFSVDVQPEHLRTTPMHASEIDSVLLNFLTNSLKAMKKAKVSPRKVRIVARADEKHVLLAFEDNGTGIEPEFQERIFEPFFTTTTDAEEDNFAGPGIGLGLKIVSDIAQSYGGWASVGKPGSDYKCRMEFRVLSADLEADL